MVSDLTDGLLQDLRGFTVRILHGTSGAVVGTGIAVSTDGRVVTCAHVIRAAGVEPRDRSGAEVGVYFPQAREPGERARRAVVQAAFPQYDDDVVVLQLLGSTAPLTEDQIAVLGTAAGSDSHDFRSYGYRR